MLLKINIKIVSKNVIQILISNCLSHCLVTLFISIHCGIDAVTKKSRYYGVSMLDRVSANINIHIKLPLTLWRFSFLVLRVLKVIYYMEKKTPKNFGFIWNWFNQCSDNTGSHGSFFWFSKSHKTPCKFWLC